MSLLNLEGLNTSCQRCYALLRSRTATGVSGIALPGLPAGAGREDQLRWRAQPPQDVLERADQLVLNKTHILEGRADDHSRVAGDMHTQAGDHPAPLPTTAPLEFRLHLVSKRVVGKLARRTIGWWFYYGDHCIRSSDRFTLHRGLC